MTGWSATIGTILLKLHERVLDPPIESLFFKPTKDPVPLAGLTIRGNNREHGHDYRPSPCRLFEWTIAALDYDLSRLTFVDHGAGKGRVMLLASQYPLPRHRRHRVRRGTA